MKDLEEITNIYIIKKFQMPKKMRSGLTRKDHELIHDTLSFQLFLSFYRARELFKKIKELFRKA